MTTIDLTAPQPDAVNLETLTWDEIKQRYPDEWVLMDQTTFDVNHDFISGRLLCHDADRDEFERFAIAWRGRTCRASVRFTGELFAEGMVYAL